MELNIDNQIETLEHISIKLHDITAELDKLKNNKNFIEYDIKTDMKSMLTLLLKYSNLYKLKVDMYTKENKSFLSDIDKITHEIMVGNNEN